MTGQTPAYGRKDMNVEIKSQPHYSSLTGYNLNFPPFNDLKLSDHFPVVVSVENQAQCEYKKGRKIQIVTCFGAPYYSEYQICKFGS